MVPLFFENHLSEIFIAIYLRNSRLLTHICRTVEITFTDRALPERDNTRGAANKFLGVSGTVQTPITPIFERAYRLHPTILLQLLERGERLARKQANPLPIAFLLLCVMLFLRYDFVGLFVLDDV